MSTPTPKSPVLLQLKAGQHVRWQPARAATVQVVGGRIWLTQANDPYDHFVDAGQSLRLQPGVATVLGAEVDAQVSVAMQPSRFARLGQLAASLARAARRSTPRRDEAGSPAVSR
ncbi:DUF2917 domain-containing protein [Caldimonas brevitalea]|uniref:DUF2917 domain-containing protein n=1 Tax=Caldimonas brevitalea TaxID=413882 RepID=A0A0G3BXE9_9BURK|nr:DUF2917 domain-containing protein [Caldimonas brevitalea]AKJ32046.1 hypothetical protein AAW51_5355 [Caldimonas brevitalea]